MTFVVYVKSRGNANRNECNNVVTFSKNQLQTFYGIFLLDIEIVQDRTKL